MLISYCVLFIHPNLLVYLIRTYVIPFNYKFILIIFQANVPIDAFIVVRTRRRYKLLCLAGDGADRWLPLQILRITLGACGRSRTAKSTKNVSTPWQPSIWFALEGSTYSLQQSEINEQHPRQQWSRKYHYLFSFIMSCFRVLSFLSFGVEERKIIMREIVILFLCGHCN